MSRRIRRYRNLPSTVFYDVLGVRADRWAEACVEYSKDQIDEGQLIGWFAAVISNAYKEGFKDAKANKRARF